jgi:signal transduction histidine kinase
MLHSESHPLLIENADLRAQLMHTAMTNEVLVRLGTTLHLPELMRKLIDFLRERSHCDRVSILILDDYELALKYGYSSGPFPSAQAKHALENIFLYTFLANDNPVVSRWLRGETAEHIVGDTLVNVLRAQMYFTAPIMADDQLIGALIADNHLSDLPISGEDQERLYATALGASLLLQNARRHTKTIAQLEANVYELSMMRQIDRELNDIIELNYVFDMTLDWALRYTAAHAASIALYEQERDTLRVVSQYGNDIPTESLALLRDQAGGGIAQRVARSGHSEMTPEGAVDINFVGISTASRSQLNVPVMREDRVIAVITIDSKKLNGFTDDHLEFIEKLGVRAGVAIDNARLYAEAVQERKQLTRILSSITDVVIVANNEQRIVLLNEAAVALLPPSERGKNHLGLTLGEVFTHSTLPELARQMYLDGKNRVGHSAEITISDERENRIFHANLMPRDDAGCIVVMHDISALHETEAYRKNLTTNLAKELQLPLTTLNRYIDLLLAHQGIDAHEAQVIEMIRRSSAHMQHFLAELNVVSALDNGLVITPRPVHLETILSQCIEEQHSAASSKNIRFAASVPDNLPSVAGDSDALVRVFSHVLNNAVKFTPPDGNVSVRVENLRENLQVAIQDSGPGINPTDQIHLFERFYRKRTPGSDAGGIGLGLSIVKGLVEAHRGHITVESELGKGSTFYVMLPVYQEKRQN